MDWILHVDTDELIYPGGAADYSLQRLLAAQPADVDNLVFPNWESMPERDDVTDPFTQVLPAAAACLLLCAKCKELPQAGLASNEACNLRKACHNGASCLLEAQTQQQRAPCFTAQLSPGAGDAVQAELPPCGVGLVLQELPYGCSGATPTTLSPTAMARVPHVWCRGCDPTGLTGGTPTPRRPSESPHCCCSCAALQQAAASASCTAQLTELTQEPLQQTTQELALTGLLSGLNLCWAVQ